MTARNISSGGQLNCQNISSDGDNSYAQYLYQKSDFSKYYFVFLKKTSIIIETSTIYYDNSRLAITSA